MADTVIVITGGTLPGGYCPASYQALLNDFVARLSGYVPNGIKGTVISATPPVAEDQDKLWIKLSGTSPIGWFIYDNGSWVRPHEAPASGDERRLWVGSTVDLQTYDGGDTNAVGPTPGPFWEVDTDFAAKFPVAPGTFASGASVAVSGIGGQETVTLLNANLPEHRHAMGLEPSAATAPSDSQAGALHAPGGSPYFAEAELTSKVAYTRNTGESAPTPLNMLPPYRGAYIIKRTARTMRVG